jgi:hypothetical protein
VTHEVSLNFLLDKTHDTLISYQLQAKEETDRFPSDRNVGIPFLWAMKPSEVN